MNGYIEGILGRTLGDLPLLRPRTPSLFEPVPPAPDPAPSSAPEPAPASAPEIPSQPPPRIEERIITNTIEHRVTEPPRVVEHTRVIREEVPVVREIERERLRTAAVPAAGKQASPPAPRGAEDAAAPAGGPLAVGTEVTPVIRKAGETPVVREMVRESSTTRTVERSRSVEIPALPEPPHRRPNVPPPASPTIRPRIEPPRVITRSTNTTNIVEAPAQEPSIRVTIGRVDVRAVVRGDAPRASTRESQGPRLSLEDYLRTRDGGRR